MFFLLLRHWILFVNRLWKLCFYSFKQFRTTTLKLVHFKKTKHIPVFILPNLHICLNMTGSGYLEFNWNKKYKLTSYGFCRQTLFVIRQRKIEQFKFFSFKSWSKRDRNRVEYFYDHIYFCFFSYLNFFS